MLTENRWSRSSAPVSAKDGRIVHNAPRPQLHTEELDALPLATDVYKRDLQIERYNVPFLLHPFVSFYTLRGCSSWVSNPATRKS